MDAGFSIELELLEPVTVASAGALLQLHPLQVIRTSIRLTCRNGEGSPQVSATLDRSRAALRELVEFAQSAQPEGTTVRVWFQGRSESFQI